MSWYGDEFDDLFGDEYDYLGAEAAQVQKLVAKRAELKAALPVVPAPQAVKVARKIQKIDGALAARGISADDVAAYGIEGIGGLMFQAQSPPGIGRLVRLPFYPTVNADANIITGGGAAAASAVVSTMSFTATAAGNKAAPITLLTPQISWATLRIVGFETSQKTQEASNAATPMDCCQPQCIVQDLQIGGGANLFTHEDYGPAALYDADQPEFCGLRDYPILKSPNTCQVTVALCASESTNAAGVAWGAGPATVPTVSFSCALLCEVLVDQNYGAHVPGPYARKGAMVRQGGSFIR